MKKLRRIDFYTIPLFIVAVVVVALRTVALFTSYNAEIMHFDDKIAIMIADIMVGLSCLGFVSYLFLGESETELIAKSDNARSYIPAGLVSVAMLFMGVSKLSVVFDGGYHEDIIVGFSLVGGLLCLLSIAAFFLSVFIENNENMYKAAFSLSIVLCLAVHAAQLFFSKDMPTNAPNKVTDQLAFISAAIFFLFESRICLGRAKWRGYVAFGLIASLLCAYSSVPTLIYYISKGQLVSDSLAQSVLAFAMSILICVKVLQIRSLTLNSECEEAKGIARLAMLREEEMEENRKLSRAQDNNNLVENDDTKDAENYTFDLPMEEPTTDFSVGEAYFDPTENVQ